MAEPYTIKVHGDNFALILPVEEAHNIRVALQPMRAGETVSTSTQNIRDRLDKALAKVGK